MSFHLPSHPISAQLLTLATLSLSGLLLTSQVSLLAQTRPCSVPVSQMFLGDPNLILLAWKEAPSAALATQALSIILNRFKTEPNGLSPWMRQNILDQLPLLAQAIARSAPDQKPQLLALFQDIQTRLQRPSPRRNLDNSPWWLALARSYHSLDTASAPLRDRPNPNIALSLTRAEQHLATLQLTPLTATASYLQLTTTALDLGDRALAEKALTMAQTWVDKIPPLARLAPNEIPVLVTLAQLQDRLGRWDAAQAIVKRLPVEKQVETFTNWALIAQERQQNERAKNWINQAQSLAQKSNLNDSFAFSLRQGLTPATLPWVSQVATQPGLNRNFDLWLTIAAEARRAKQADLNKRALQVLLTLLREAEAPGSNQSIPGFLRAVETNLVTEFPTQELYQRSQPELSWLAGERSLNRYSVVKIHIAAALEAQKFGEATRHAVSLRNFRERCPIINLTPTTVPCDADPALTALNQVMEAAAQARQPQAAIAVLSRFEKENDRIQARWMLMRSFFKTKQDAVGLELLKQIADLNSSTDLSLAGLLLQVGRTKEAEMILNRVTQTALKLSNLNGQRDFALARLVEAYLSGNQSAVTKGLVSRIQDVNLRRSLEEKLICL
jgi:tetratricopeptide (TPR) repeat protein